MTKETPEHKDILGQPLAVGNYVAMCRRNSMKICCITKITPKQIRVRALNVKGGDGWLVYPIDTVLLSGPDALAYILVHSGA